MFLFPFSFLTSGVTGPVNETAPVIAITSGVNRFSYTPGVWGATTTSTTVEWFEDGMPTGISTETYTANIGSSVYLLETGYNALGDSNSRASNTIVLPALLTPPVIVQNEADFVIYDTVGVWDGTVSSISAYWVINGLLTATVASLGNPTDITAIGAVSGDDISLIEFTNGTTIGGLSNTLAFISFSAAITESTGLDFTMSASVIDAVPMIEESVGLTFTASGFTDDNPQKITENSAVTYSVSGSIV